MRQEMIMAVVAAISPEYDPKVKTKIGIGTNHKAIDQATKAVDAIIALQGGTLMHSQIPSKPIDAYCDACFAQPGEACTQPSVNGRVVVNWFHLSRREAVLD